MTRTRRNKALLRPLVPFPSARDQIRLTLFALSLIALTSCGSALGQQAEGSSQSLIHSYVPPNGFVPDEATATRVAEAILIAIYGREQISSELPLKAKLVGDVWYVEGSHPQDFAGGVAIVQLAKSDARIIRVTHGK